MVKKKNIQYKKSPYPTPMQGKLKKGVSEPIVFLSGGTSKITADRAGNIGVQ